jgi:hypothetical protein
VQPAEERSNGGNCPGLPAAKGCGPREDRIPIIAIHGSAAERKDAPMFESRFNHVAACEAAREHASLLHIRRLRISLLGLFDEDVPREDVSRKVTELELRENALWRFIEDPYQADSLLRIFHAGDRAIVLDAGRPTATGTIPAICITV